MSAKPATRNENQSAATLPDRSQRQLSLKNWGDLPEDKAAGRLRKNAIVDCGWGRLIFGQTFRRPQEIAERLGAEEEGRRDVAFYVRDPQLVIAADPQSLFLDPSQSFRLDLSGPPTARHADGSGIAVRAADSNDERSINQIYKARHMVPLPPGYCAGEGDDDPVQVLVAHDRDDPAEIHGVVMGVDHRLAFDDPDNGSSLWALAVDPQSDRPGVGAALVSALAEKFRIAGRDFMDLSVMHDNEEAIALYDKLGFVQVPIYCVKRKNPINEELFVGRQDQAQLNIYAQIIVDEARRRGIRVDIDDAEAGLFTLSLGGRSVACRESLSELTSAVALSRCDDKRLTRRLLAKAGLNVPDQTEATGRAQIEAFFAEHERLVVKPARGEMGHGVAVDLTDADAVEAAVETARLHSDAIVLEPYLEGSDLRIIVIDGEVVAAAVRRPPSIRGDGTRTIAELIDKQSRRRAAATSGESRIPVDEETDRCVIGAGYRMTDILREGEVLTVRKTANLHAGGTIHDVTDTLHPDLAAAAVAGAEALDMPVVGFDFIVPDPAGPDYTIIEANERPGLANHEPQPTVEKFIDFLFPQSKRN